MGVVVALGPEFWGALGSRGMAGTCGVMYMCRVTYFCDSGQSGVNRPCMSRRYYTLIITVTLTLALTLALTLHDRDCAGQAAR